MDYSHLLDKCFVPFFQQKLALWEDYKWKVDTSALKAKGLELSACCNADRNIELKHKLEDLWQSSSFEERVFLAKWIIRDWGRIKNNDPKKYEDYAKMAQESEPKFPLHGIASYSKVLAFSNITQYAIYDARVAAALNAAQAMMMTDNRIFFHYLPGRNSIIQGSKKTPNGFVKVFSKDKLQAMGGWVFPKPDETYLNYLNLLYALKAVFIDYEIYHFEMILFSIAPELCKHVLDSFDGKTH